MQSSRRKNYVSILNLALVAILLWLQTSENEFISKIRDRLEHIAYDVRLKSTLPDNTDYEPKVVIVDIDENSLQAEGHWPWPRDKIARLVDNLYNMGTIVVAFDIVFAESDKNSANIILDEASKNPDEQPTFLTRLHELVPEFDNDKKFATSLTDQDAVLGFVLHNREGKPSGQPPTPLVVKNNINALLNSIQDTKNYTANLPILQSASGFGGFISTAPDLDGTIRRTPLLMKYGDNVFGSLALEAARLFLLVDDISITTGSIGEEERIEYIHMGKTNIPTDYLGNALIPYRGPFQTFPYISATDVLNNNIPAGTLENKIVLIGTSAEGLFDLRPTPVGGAYAGVEIHANIIASILDNHFKSEPTWSDGADFLFILIFGVLLAIFLPYFSVIWMLIVTISLTVLVIFGNFWAWNQLNIALSLTLPLLVIISVTALNLTLGFFIESTGRKQLKSRFGQYVPPQLVEEMNRNPQSYSADGETREMTVLFADIRNFTSISESLTATELKNMLNHFFTPMTRIIFENRGTIDKYVGDMIMSFWGAPVKDNKHAIHAITAAMEMLAEAERLKPEFEAEGLPEVNIGIGLNTGMMNVGDMGSDYRRAYTVLGDAVNLASRLEGLTKFYGVNLVVSETTRADDDPFIYRTLDLVKVKGKEQAVQVFEPICRKEEASEELKKELEQHEQALELYMSQQWDQAENSFNKLIHEYPATYVYQLYLERIHNLRVNPPGTDWDGSFTRTSK